ncbi:hypothetical protein QQ045_007939 [Rhodiola kirilowii]
METVDVVSETQMGTAVEAPIAETFKNYLSKSALKRARQKAKKALGKTSPVTSSSSSDNKGSKGELGCVSSNGIGKVHKAKQAQSLRREKKEGGSKSYFIFND